MKTLNVVENDLDFTIVEGKQEIMRCLELEIGSMQQEFILDEELGIASVMLEDKPDIEDILFEVQRVIANEPRVQMVGDITYELDKATRTLSVRFTVEEVATGEIWSQEVGIGGANE